MTPQQLNKIHLSSFEKETQALVKYFAEGILELKNPNLICCSDLMCKIGEGYGECYYTLQDILTYLRNDATKEEVEAYQNFIIQTDIDNTAIPKEKAIGKTFFRLDFKTWKDKVYTS